MTSSKCAEVIALAAERLELAAAAHHQVPVRLGPVGEWLQLAAVVHATEVGCEWCAAGACPAVETALALLGAPPPELVARAQRAHRAPRRDGGDPR